MNNTERIKIVAALHEIAELIDGYVDVKDGDYGQQIANDAMKAAQLIDELLADVNSTPRLQPNSDARLKRLNDARSTLRNPDVGRQFDARLIGALSNHVDDEGWASCLHTALNGLMGQSEVAS